jgi:hypothetical protein
MKSSSSRFARKPLISGNASGTENENSTIDYDQMDFTVTNSNTSDQSRKRPLETSKDSNKALKKADIQRLMDENRETTQSIAIAKESKGYKLLEKFGYSASQGGLGKLGTGLVVPIAVIKRDGDDRSGIGKSEHLKKKADEKVEKQVVIEKGKANMVQSYKRDVLVQQRITQSTKFLKSASKVIYELDFRAGITENDLWPSEEVEEFELTDVRDEQNESISTFHGESYAEDRLENCLMYLKDRYNYCLHCGCQYEDIEEFDRCCPGPLEDDH